LITYRRLINNKSKNEIIQLIMTNIKFIITDAKYGTLVNLLE